MEPRSVNIHEELINRCRAGNREAQFELYKLYSKAMYNTAYRICGSQADAEDSLQESFVSAFKNLDQYRGESSFGAWLKRIVINKSLNLVNKRNQQGHVTTDDVDVPFYDWEEVPDHSLTIKSIRQAIEELPHGFRSVITLYLFEGYDHKEIGEILGISESTSKSQYNRAKQKIRMLIGKEVKYG